MKRSILLRTKYEKMAWQVVDSESHKDSKMLLLLFSKASAVDIAATDPPLKGKRRGILVSSLLMERRGRKVAIKL